VTKYQQLIPIFPLDIKSLPFTNELTISAQILLGPNSGWPKSYSAQILLGPILAWPKSCSAQILLGPIPARPNSCLAQFLLGPIFA